LILLVGVFFFFRTMFAPAGELPSLLGQNKPAQAPAAARAPAAATQAPNPAGPVVFTAAAPGIWVKFYDARGKTLFEKQLALAESYTVPADAQGPMLWTGRPDALAITVGGKPVAKLADQQQVMKDVPVTAAALIARTNPSSSAAVPAPAPRQAPTAAVPPSTRPAPSPTA
jgi:hypothetical protein